MNKAPDGLLPYAARNLRHGVGGSAECEGRHAFRRQRQALALILANMTDIELLILDEHTAALDPKSSETVMRITDKLVKEKQVTSLMVTHNLRFCAGIW